MKFRATIELGGKTATGIQVPDKIVERLGSGKHPKVRATIKGIHLPQQRGLDGRKVHARRQRGGP